MKVIFDNEQQKIDFFNVACPSDVGLVDNCQASCDICWAESELEFEVKTE